MRHDATIPPELHSGAGASVKEALGSFWSTVFRDQELVDAAVSARVLSACQAYIDAMEALSLRDHANMPTFHREHWHPLLVRLSERNTGCGLVLGMEGDPKIGPQRSPSTIFKPDEVFVVGGNAEFSKVNTYPLDPATRGSLVSVGTCICDSIAEPEHILVSGRDFELRGDVLLVRKEHDPFEVGGYRIVEEGDDRIAVLWLCDAEFDRDHVGDFLGYPLGFDVRSTPESARMLSAMWDAVVYGLTPLHLNRLLGALFGIPVLPRDSIVESVARGGGTDTVVTDDAVYQVPTAVKAACVVAGARLPAGTFLTDEIAVYHGLSKDEVEALVDGGDLSSLTLPVGSVAGLDASVELGNISSQVQEAPARDNDPWFRLNSSDSGSSAFWAAVRARTTADVRKRLCSQLFGAEWHDNLFHLCEYAAHDTACTPHVPGSSVLVDTRDRSITLRKGSNAYIYTRYRRDTTLDASGMMGFPVTGGASYTVSCHITASGKVWGFFFDVDGMYISQDASVQSFGGATNGDMSVNVTAPENAGYLALFFYTVSTEAVFTQLSVRRADRSAIVSARVNPLKTLGYLALANTVLVYTTRDPLPGMCAEYALDVLRRLMPPTGSVQVIRTESIAGASSVGAAEVAWVAGAGHAPAPPDSSVAMGDDVKFELLASVAADSRMGAASDSVVVRFIPDPVTEV